MPKVYISVRDDNPFRDPIFHVIIGLTCMMVLGISSIIPILPMLGKTFNIPTEQTAWVLTAFTLPGVVFTPIAGVLADRYGRKEVLIPSLFIFCIGGCACAFANDFPTLVFFRFIQGTGAASFGLLYTTLIADHYEGAKRLKIMGFNSAILSIGTATFPALGGVLAEVHWRLPFFLPIIAIGVMILAWRRPMLPPTQTTTLKGYLVKSWKAASAKQTRVLFLLTFCTFAMLYGPIITCLPMLTDSRHNLSPSEIGLIMATAAIGSGLVASQTGRMSKYMNPRQFLYSSQVCYVGAMLGLLFIHTAWLLPIPVLLFGMGQGFNMPTTGTMLMNESPPEQRASIMAFNGVLLRLSQTISPLAFSAIVAFSSLDGAYMAGILLAVCMTCITLQLQLSTAPKG